MDLLRIANSSGFYGDRFSAPREMIDGGPIDVLTGDYLAELTMAILERDRSRHPHGGYARTFLRQMEDVLADCDSLQVKIVSNAGGLAPGALADELQKIIAARDLGMRVAHITGDDMMDRLDKLVDPPPPATMLRPSVGKEHQAPVLTANAYVGGWGISRALSEGADVVVTGHVTDAALVMGPAAAHFQWAIDDWDPLAGALVAGHLIECGAQATGGNFSFFKEISGLDRIGFPLVEMEPDGSFVVTKHPGSGGAVTVETITAQLLYEIAGPRYHNPDVTARFDTVRLIDDGLDRVRVDGIRGEPPPRMLKVATHRMGGFRNAVTFVLTGLDVLEKAAVAESALWSSVGDRETFEDTAVHLIGCPVEDPVDNENATALLHVSVRDPDPEKVGRAFSDMAVGQALAGYPGFYLTEPPGGATTFAVFRPMAIDSSHVDQLVHLGDAVHVVATPAHTPAPVEVGAAPSPSKPNGPMRNVLLGRIVGARSGDKGGDANVGIWVRDRAAWPWLYHYLTTERLRTLLPEAVDLPIERYVFENVAAVNFVIGGLLGDGVGSSMRFDRQAKSLGEFLRSRFVDVPVDVPVDSP